MRGKSIERAETRMWPKTYIFRLNPWAPTSFHGRGRGGFVCSLDVSFLGYWYINRGGSAGGGFGRLCAQRGAKTPEIAETGDAPKTYRFRPHRRFPFRSIGQLIEAVALVS